MVGFGLLNAAAWASKRCVGEETQEAHYARLGKCFRSTQHARPGYSRGIFRESAAALHGILELLLSWIARPCCKGTMKESMSLGLSTDITCHCTAHYPTEGVCVRDRTAPLNHRFSRNSQHLPNRPHSTDPHPHPTVCAKPHFSYLSANSASPNT